MQLLEAAKLVQIMVHPQAGACLVGLESNKEPNNGHWVSATKAKVR